MNLTILKRTIQWHLVGSQYAMHIAMQSPPHLAPNIFITPKETLYSLSCYSTLFPSPSSWHLPVCFLSLWICLFWIIHINGIMQYVTFVMLFSLNIMFSSFIHVSILHSFSWLNNIPLYTYTTICLSIVYMYPCLLLRGEYPLVDIWVSSTFWLLWIMLLWTCVHT